MFFRESNETKLFFRPICRVNRTIGRWIQARCVVKVFPLHGISRGSVGIAARFYGLLQALAGPGVPPNCRPCDETYCCDATHALV